MRPFILSLCLFSLLISSFNINGSQERGDEHLPLVEKTSSQKGWWPNIWPGLKRIGERSEEFLFRHSDLIGMVVELPLTAIYFASAMSGDKALEALDYMALNIFGVAFLFLNIYQIRLLIKNFKDFLYAQRCHNLPIAIDTLGKNVKTFTDYVLTITGTMASVYIKNGDMQTVTKIYNIMIPVGLASLGLGMGLQLYHYFSNRHFLKIMKEFLDDKNEDAIKQIVQAYSSYPLLTLEDQDVESDILKLASAFESRVDANSWAQFLKRCKELKFDQEGADQEKIDSFLADLRENIDVQQTKTKGMIYLLIQGDLLQILCKLFPFSLFQASVELGEGTLYALLFLWTKIKEAQNRDHIHQHQDGDPSYGSIQ